MEKLKLAYLSPGQLRADARNPRIHPKRQLADIQASISAFGFCNPILIDEDRLIIAGHGRCLAAKALGLDLVPVVTLTGLSDAQKRALRIADNKLAQGSGWDTDLLRVELEFISSVDVSFDLALTGFSSAEIDFALQKPKGGGADLDEMPAIAARPVSCAGDIWLLGSHCVGCGDVRDRSFLRSVVGGTDVDAAFLDPPYNIPINGFCVSAGSHREFAVASGELSDAAFTTFLEDSLGACVAVSRDGSVHFVCMDHRHIEHLAEVGSAVYAERLNVCVWNKTNGGMGSLYRSKHELIGVFKVGDGPFYNAVELGKHGRNRTNVWDYPSVNTFNRARREDLKLHPTVKPCALVADAIMDVTRPKDLVLDAFLGSGTTLLACEQTNRRCRGVELDPLYADLAVRRWMDATGGEAVLQQTGDSFGLRERLSEVPEIV